MSSATTVAPAVTTTVAPAVTTTAASDGVDVGPLLKTADVRGLGHRSWSTAAGLHRLHVGSGHELHQRVCTGGCAGTWPAVLVPDGTATPTADGVSGTLASSARSDGGGNQLTLDGKPLYRYATARRTGRGQGRRPWAACGTWSRSL